MYSAEEIHTILEERGVCLLGNRVAVLPFQQDEFISEHIVRAETYQYNPQVGQVVCVGDGVEAEVFDELFMKITTYNAPMSVPVLLSFNNKEPIELYIIHVKDLKFYWPEEFTDD